jgi:hypothetical protein
VKDTPEEVERKFRKMIAQRSGEERLMMGCSMHATARALVKASIMQQHPKARPAEIKRLLFLRFYAGDFSPEERRRVARAIKNNSRTSARRPRKRRRAAKRTRHSRVQGISSGALATRLFDQTMTKRKKSQ